MLSRWLARRVDPGSKHRRGASGAIARHPPAVPPGIRIYAIGDIHGRHDLLDRMLLKIDAHAEADPCPRNVIVLVGDYIDRGPHSAQVLDRLVALSMGRDIVMLRGNHEAMMIDALSHPSRLASWISNGGRETLLSYGLDSSGQLNSPTSAANLSDQIFLNVPDSHISLLKTLDWTFLCGDYLFVHAGVHPDRSLHTQRPRDLLWIREPFLSWPADFGAVIVHGHSPVPRPEQHPNRINIDTGAYVTGRLTCLILKDTIQDFIQT